MSMTVKGLRGSRTSRVRVLESQIEGLAEVLQREFGGPTYDESACEMAVRVLREQREKINEKYDVRVDELNREIGRLTTVVAYLSQMKEGYRNALEGTTERTADDDAAY